MLISQKTHDTIVKRATDHLIKQGALFELRVPREDENVESTVDVENSILDNIRSQESKTVPDIKYWSYKTTI